MASGRTTYRAASIRLAGAIIAEARKRNLALSKSADFESGTGIGVRGTGTVVAMASGKVTLVKGDLRGIARAHDSEATVANMKQNLAFALVYNAQGVPIPAGVLYPFTGLLLSPLIAALVRSLSSVSVVTNA